MRYLTELGVAVLALMMGGPWLTSAAQTPRGSYRETCRDTTVRGSTLYASCKDTNNNWHPTQLNNFERCGGQIQNLNGNLACPHGGGHGHGYGYGSGPSAPRDTYRQTCQDIHTDGNTLKAKCQKVDGGWRDTSLNNYNRCQRIVNEDGHLRCM